MSELLQSIILWFQTHPLMALAAVVVIGLLLWKNPKAMVKLVAIVLAFALLYGIVSMLGTATLTGVDSKTEMVDKAP